MRKLLFVGAILFFLALPLSARGPRGHGHGRVHVGVGVSVVPWGWGPWGFSSFGYWGAPYGFGPYRTYSGFNAGKVKVETDVKDAKVFIDGGLAGTVGELKSFRLKQGAYNLEVRSPGGGYFAERIYVVNGKTRHVHPEFAPKSKP